MRSRNLFWGLFFLGAGCLIILGQMDVLEGNIYRILATSFLGIVALSNIPRRNFGSIMFSIALIVWLNSGYLGISHNVSLWGLLIAATLTSIGLSMIFKKKGYMYCGNRRNWTHGHYGGEFSNSQSNQDDDVVRCSVSMSSSSQYLHSTNLESVSLSCSMGNLQVYFDQSTPSVNGVDIDVDCSLGNIELYIPRDWNVRNSISVTLGAAEEEYKRVVPDGNGPTVRLHGSVRLGAVKVIYI